MSSDDSTNGLPYNQPCIPTSEIQRCMKHINAWWKDAKRTLGPLGIIYGDAGIGKTMAVQNGLLKSEPEKIYGKVAKHMRKEATNDKTI